MSCSMSIEKKLREVKIFQLQSLSNAIRCIDQRFALRILVFRVWPWYSIWTIREQQACMQKNPLQVAKYNESCTVFFQLYGLVVKVSRRESVDLGSIPSECWRSLPRLGHISWHWARQCTYTRTFYIDALPIIVFFFDFVSGNLALTEL